MFARKLQPAFRAPTQVSAIRQLKYNPLKTVTRSTGDLKSAGFTPFSTSESVHQPSGKPTLRRVRRDVLNAKEIVRIMSEDGAVVIEGLLTQDQVARYNAETEPALAAMHPGSLVDHEEIQSFHGRNTKRLCNLTTLSKTFREEVINSDTIHSICDEFFHMTGDYWLSTAQVMSIGPGSPRQPLHRDHGNWYPARAMGPSMPESSISFLLAQNNTTEENGATLAIPRSHLWDFTLENDNLGSYEQCTIVELNAGDALVIGGKIVHGGGANRTKDIWRKVTTVMFCNAAFTQEEAFQIVLDRELVKKLPERVKKVLGFRTVYPLQSPGLNTLNNDDIAEYLGW
ncbi:hypothetical protein EIK77_002516 [Talaromyces pinophilus]|nr:hypothetical protein EIK77_002516 [Talaromyces pinophilus]PCG93125.1 Phytanoyl-CoA dioxygenase [Penicillium occitanis (nom. inval.)]PCG93350.1 hypothetical protein PENOC_088210 [Penicillium occitanis (nom. inval.)]